MATALNLKQKAEQVQNGLSAKTSLASVPFSYSCSSNPYMGPGTVVFYYTEVTDTGLLIPTAKKFTDNGAGQFSANILNNSLLVMIYTSEMAAFNNGWNMNLQIVHNNAASINDAAGRYVRVFDISTLHDSEFFMHIYDYQY